MKNTRPPSSSARTPYYEPNAAQVSRSDPPRAQNGAPPGTVASRVQFLQSLQRTGNTGPPPLPPQVATPSSRRRENSRTGFGRRLTNRFGPPAVQSGQPFEDARTDTSHSFLGLNIPRKSHVEEHGLADNRIRYSKSPGINGTIAPTTRERSQYDAVAPWGSLSRSKSSRSMGRKNDNNDMDGNRSELLAYHSHIVAEATIFPRPPQEDDPSRFRRNFKSNEANTLKSEASFATASTIRRQSVRDLFDDYGIERPAGLASSKESSRDAEDTPRPTRPHRFCHLCSWVNSSPSVKCWRCSHRLCSICDAQSPQPVTRKEPSLLYSGRFSKGKGLENQPSRMSPREYEAVDIEPVKETTVRPRPSVIQAKKEEHVLQPRKRSSPPTNFPDFHPELVPTIEPSQASHPPKTVPEVSQKAAPDRPETQVKTSVKDSPFMIADSTAKKQSIALITSGSKINGVTTHPHHQPHFAAKELIVLLLIASIEPNVMQSRERKRKRSGIPVKKPRMVMWQIQATLKKRCITTLIYTHILQTRHRIHTHIFQYRNHKFHTGLNIFMIISRRKRVRVMYQSLSSAMAIHELVMFVTEAFLGQNLLANANIVWRIANHKAIVHQHHTPQREATLLDLHIRPLSTPRKASIPSRPSITVPPRPQSSIVEHFIERSPAQNGSPKQILSTGPSLEKLPNFPVRKRSTFIQKAKKPPTPPPWVTIPRSSLLKAFKYDPTDDVLQEKAPDPFASLRKITTPPPTSTWGVFNQDAKNEQKEKLWSSSYTENSKDYARKDYQDSSKIPSRKNSAVNEKRSISSKGNTRSSSRMKISPPGSRRASRRLSALFQPRKKNSVPKLTQKLLQHQEELRDSRRDRDEQIQAALLGAVTSRARNLEHGEEKFEEGNRKSTPLMRESRMSSRAVSTDSTRKWRLRLVDKRPSSPCENDLALKGHRLDDNMLEKRPTDNQDRSEDRRVMSEACLDTYNDKSAKSRVETQDRKVMSKARLNILTTQRRNVEAGTEFERGKFERVGREATSEALMNVNTPERSVEGHECSWKRMVLEVQSGNPLQCNHRQTSNMGIMGVTIILHFDDREDMILKAGSWSTTSEPELIR
ncbi:hypothetical protein BDZ45DRAFT_737935 [Acephala macrosclerotiorum]|nr:hypothetical protein BDZ45DRAFT_737935 [Acephala macrosclerotiorum]